MKKAARTSFVVVFDLACALVAWVGAYLFRFNFSWPVHYTEMILFGAVPLVVAHGVICRWAGLYRGMWIFASLPDLRRVLKAVIVSALVLVCISALDRRSGVAMPRSVLALYPLILILLMGGGRAAWRMWKEHWMYGRLNGLGKPVVVVGAGTGGALLVRELVRSPDWHVVALVDDDKAKHGLELYGHPVVGAIDDLPSVLNSLNVEHVILAMPSAAADALSRAAELAVSCGAHTFTVPRLEDIMAGKVAINAMRPVAIDDLLGRDPVSIETDEVRSMVSGKTVMVTGAGGSIGSELCRQLIRFGPRTLILFEGTEFVLYTIDQSLGEMNHSTEVVPLIGDVKDQRRLDEVFGRWRPELVFHAAAYKHVPLMEVGNAWQAVRNNVLGTLVVARAAQEHGTGRFVLVSTDKAVNPTNVMGATKRLAEMVCEALHTQKSGTQFEIVRFGNVLGSTGSVIPKFQKQIERGGPVTVTHAEINRFFMSIPEAAQLVLQAASMGRGGEIFVLDMGEPVKIVDLARNMIRLCGYSEDDIRIEFTGLRPGEKLFEELLADAELTRQTQHPKLRIAQSRPVDSVFLPALIAWLEQTGPVSDDRVRSELQRWVPEYTPAVKRRGLMVIDGRSNDAQRAS